MNYNLMTNKELSELRQELIERFNKAQQELKECYTTMVECSTEAIKIKEILTKREGKK